MHVAKILEHVFHQEVRAVDPTVVRVEGNYLKCFHVAFILFGRCNRQLTVTGVMKSVYRYGRGVRRASTVREIYLKQ